jgi:fucose 4-O-acetylase-like acetyltransferase
MRRNEKAGLGIVFLHSGFHVLLISRDTQMLLSHSYKTAGRNQVLDIAKGIGIILVVYCHSLELGFLPNIHVDADVSRLDFQLWRFIYSFHMPFFFLVSGITFKPHETFYVLKESLRLILIAQITGIFGLALKYLLLFPHSTDISLNNDIIAPLLLNYNFSIVVTWFLVSLALVRLSYHFFHRGSLIEKLLVIYLLLSLFSLNQITKTNFFEAGTLLSGFAFYFLGHRLSKILSAPIHYQRNIMLLILAALLLATYFIETSNNGCLLYFTDHCNFFKEGFAVLMIYGNIGFIPSFLAAAILGSLSILVLANYISHSPAPSKVLAVIGAFSLELLIINGFFLRIFQLCIKYYLSFDTLAVMPTFFAAAALTIAQLATLWLLLRFHNPDVLTLE